MYSTTIPNILQNKCIIYNKNELNQSEFKVKCIYCNLELVVERKDNLQSLNTHLITEIHKTKELEYNRNLNFEVNYDSLNTIKKNNVHKIPEVLKRWYFKYNKNEFTLNTFNIECICCSIVLKASRSSGWRNLYSHVQSERHKLNEITFKDEEEAKINGELPNIFRTECFDYTLKQIKEKDEFITTCNYCSTSHIARKSNNWLDLYYHLRSKSHQDKIGNIILTNEFSENDDDIQIEPSLSVQNNKRKYEDNSDVIETPSFNDYNSKDIRNAQEKLEKINREIKLNKSSLEYFTNIKLDNDKHIEQLKRSLSLNNHEFINLRQEINRVKLENNSIQDEIAKIEQEISNLKHKNNKNDDELLLEETFKLKAKLNEFVDVFKTIKQDLKLKSTVNDHLTFELELVEMFQSNN